MSFVRERIRERIEKRVGSFLKGYRQNVGIVGPEGIGKTRLLSDVFTSIGALPDLIPVFIDARAVDLEYLAERWTQAVLEGARSAGLSVPECGRPDAQGLESSIPKTAEKIRRFKKLVRHDKSAATVREMFSLLPSLVQETGKKAVVVIDEFQELERLPVPDPFALLGKEIMVAKDVFYLVSSSVPCRAREIFRDKLSMLFGNFEIIELKPLKFQETGEFLRRCLPGASFSGAQRRFLIELTDGQPAYLSLIAERIETFSGNGFAGEVSDEALVRAVASELGHTGRIAALFAKRMENCGRMAKDGAAYVRALLAVAGGLCKASAVAGALHRKVMDTQKILTRLVQEDFLVRYGNFYCLADYLFRFWVSHVWKSLQQYCPPDRPFPDQALEAKLYARLRSVGAVSGADVLRRAERLLLSFRNEVVEMAGKKIRCPQFSEVILRPSEGRFLSLLARGAKTRWLCQVAVRAVREEDVAALAEEDRKLRKKIKNKIVFALAGIDQNAKLMAQAADVQIWGLRQFNVLLDLFGEPRVILTEDDLGESSDEANVGALAQSVHTV